MRSPFFAICCWAICAVSGLSAQNTNNTTDLLANYASPFDDPAILQTPADGSVIKGDLIANQWLLSPNPVHDAHFLVNIDLVYPTDLEARIISATGQIKATERFSQLSEGLTTLEFQLGDYPNGIYYLNLRNSTGLLTIPFVVAN